MICQRRSTQPSQAWSCLRATSSLLIMTMASTIAGNASRQSVTIADDAVDPAAAVAGDDAEQAADDEADDGGADADDQRGAGAVDAPGEDVVPSWSVPNQSRPPGPRRVAGWRLAVDDDLLRRSRG